MVECYYDYLIDCALLIGANESTGIIPPPNSTSRDNAYQQQIIGAVSSTVAMFPFSASKYEYPPEKFRKPEQINGIDESQHHMARQISENEFQTIHELVNQHNKKEVSDVNLTSTINRRNSKLRSKRRSIKNIAVDAANQSWGSVSMETIKSFPAIYFKNNLQISSIYKPPLIQFIPLTDNMGNRSFAIRLEFFRKFTIIPNLEIDVDKVTVMELEMPTLGNEDSTEVIFIPNNVIFFTKFSYFDLFRDILTCFFNGIKTGDNNVKIEKQLLEYCLILTRIPVLKSANLQLTFSIDVHTFTLKRTIAFFHEIIDWDMTILFKTLTVENILSILMAMFQEQKIVFLSDDSNLTTIVTESLFLLFRPFQWKHFYLTTTPTHLYELVDAIFPFMLGLPHGMKSKIIEYYPDIIIVDLQEGDTLIPTSCELKSVSKELTDKLKQAFLQRDWIVSNEFNCSLNPLSMEEHRENYFSFNERFTKKVLSIFMTFMVDLFEEVIENISTGKGSDAIVVTFDKYLNTSQSQNVAFFKNVYRTDNFNCFIDERIRRKIIDSWFHICSQRYPRLADESKLKTTLKSQRQRPDSDFPEHIDEIITLVEEPLQTVVFPSVKNIRANFYHDILEGTTKLNNSIDVMKLKAEIKLSAGGTIRALEEFHKILRISSSNLNHSKLRRIVRALGEKNFKRLLKLPFYSSFFEMISFNERMSIQGLSFEPIRIEQFNPPTSPISKYLFIEVCENADITDNEVAANALFNCLTVESKTTKNRIKTVNPNVFKCFYNNWVNLSLDLQDIEMSTDFVDEVLIKGTDTSIRVDGYGLGRIILTQYRLCFIPFAKNDCVTMVNFMEGGLRRVKMEIKLRGFGKRSEVLELSLVNRDSKIIIWVGQDSNIWFQLISEISLVNRLAEKEKDKSLIGVMADLCLMYENMVTCSKSDSFFKNNIVEIGKKMLPNINEKKSSKKEKDEDQRKYIIVKLMPAPKKIVTIDCAVEVYKPLVNNFDIWCACMCRDQYFIKILQILGEKCYKLLQDVSIEMTNRVQTMVTLPNTNKIAIGCMSHVVLIVDITSHVIDRRIILNINTAAYPICSANSEYDQRLLYFGTNKGEIMFWDSQSDKVNQIIKLPKEDHASSIHVYDSSTIIVGSLYQFYVITNEGSIKNMVVISEFANIMSKVSYITLANNNKTIIASMSRLPVLLEYDISDLTEIKCTRRKNIFTNKEYSTSEITELYELSSTNVGITTILPIENSAHGKCLWIMFKDGTIEIRDSQTWYKITKFNAHIDVITKGILCTIKNQKIVVSVGREDGKVNLWSLSPLCREQNNKI